MPKYRIHIAVRFFWDTDRQVPTVVMETAQLVLSQLKTFNLVNWEMNKVYPYRK